MCQHCVSDCALVVTLSSCSAPGGAGLSFGHLFHLHLSVWAVPQRSSCLSQSYGQSGGGKRPTSWGKLYLVYSVNHFCAQYFQMLVYLFYALPLLTVFIYGLQTPGCSWMLDWTIFFAGAMAQVSAVIMALLWFQIPHKSKMESFMLTSSTLAVLSRPSGAISEHLCIPALPSRTESQQTNGCPLSPSMCCSLLRRLCWPCAATQTPLILWSPFLRDNPTTRKRKTRPHTSLRLLRNAHWGTNWIKCAHFSSVRPRGNLKTLLSESTVKNQSPHPALPAWTFGPW